MLSLTTNPIFLPTKDASAPLERRSTEHVANSWIK